jgi:formylglycine-generating enzyme required for sulfatase activity
MTSGRIGTMPTVFVSHSSQDRDFVEREIVRPLQQRGVEVWYARDSIQTADQWERCILKGLEGSEWFLVVMSPRAAASRWVKAEVDWAVNHRREPGRIVPVLMEECSLEKFHLFLPQLQHIDFTDGPDEARRKLLAVWGLCPPLEAPQPPDVAPPRPVSRRTSRLLIAGLGAVLFSALLAAAAWLLRRDDPPPKEFTNTLGMKLVLIPKGQFKMGSPEAEQNWAPEESPRHDVEITHDFYMGATEVTVGQFRQFVNDSRYRTEAEEAGAPCTWQKNNFTQSSDHPVVCVSWNDAAEFCRWLSRKEDKTYELPFEAEWEYACRAETTTAWYSGDNAEDLGEYAWFVSNSGNSLKPVGKKKPNAWGLHDMHGNVREWCQDGQCEYRKEPIKDQRGDLSGKFRVMRGGTSFSDAPGCRSAVRGSSPREYFDHKVGFRVVCRPRVRNP